MENSAFLESLNLTSAKEELKATSKKRPKVKVTMHVCFFFSSKQHALSRKKKIVRKAAHSVARLLQMLYNTWQMSTQHTVLSLI